MFALGKMVRKAIRRAVADQQEEKRAAYQAQQLRYNAHHAARPKHPNEAILKAMAESPGPRDDSYWEERTQLFRPVDYAIQQWDARFWESETYLENPDEEWDE